jgi:ribose transport system permease protein
MGLTRAGGVAKELLRRYSFGFALILLVVLLIVDLAKQSNFGWTQQLGTFAPLALAAMASTPAIISGGGGFDLSISPLMTFISAVLAVWLAPHGLGGAIAVPILLVMGAGVGAFTGLITTRLRIPPVVATLSMYFILIGVDLRIVPVPKSLHASWMSHLAGSVGPIPGGLITIGLPLLVWTGLGATTYLRTLYAVGSNDATAFSSGVNVNAVRVAAYALGGLFAAVGGMALSGLVNSADGSSASAYTLVAIASVALGGTSLWGGRGGLIGAVIGAGCIYLIESLLGTLGVASSWLEIVYGLVLLVAIILSGLTQRPGAVATGLPSVSATGSTSQ